MPVEAVNLVKSAFPEKAGARTPTALLEAKSMRQSTLTEHSSGAECPTCGEQFDSDVAMKAHHQHHNNPYYEVLIRRRFDIEPAEFLRKHHVLDNLTLKETGDVIGASVCAIRKMADRHDVDTRDWSEATEVEWEQMSLQERQEQVKAAHEKTRELVEKGEHNLAEYWAGLTAKERAELTEAARTAQAEMYSSGCAIGHWVENNPEEHVRIAKQNAHKGTPARKENGMKGRTGQDNPNWRGGKHLVDSLRKQLRPSWWTVRDDERAEECCKCGASGCKLDVHHIVPISAGGTNGSWNLMTLCESCHREAEAYTRQYDAFSPVYTE